MLRTGACLALLLSPLLAQRVALPNATGGLTPDAKWTVLQAADLEPAARASDPKDEPARTILLAMIGDLRGQQRTAQHVIFHQPGATAGTIRVVNAYSDDNTATSSEVLREGTAESVRQTLEPTLAADGTKVTYLGHEDAKLFTIGSLVLHFELEKQGVRWQLHHHVVPAGEQIQYFETLHAVDDKDAPAAIDALLRTFDGAKEGQFDPVLRNMLIGGMAGGIAGILAARLRQRRRAALAASTASTTGQ